MPESANEAVFLSYASQDSDAARRLAEALRALGVEVWFDQNELAGGDAWDQKIRGQIKECALFVPIISRTTQARREGYFRVEWKLAAQRTQALADGTPFILPVVIDATHDADALVPEEFRAVQWTRFAEGETPPAFCARVKKLLRGETAGATRGPFAVPPRAVPPVIARPSKLPWVLAAGVVLAVGTFLALRGRTDGDGKAKPSESVGTAAGSPPYAAAAPSPASGWVAKARALFEPWDLATRDDFLQADQFLKRAMELDPSDAEGWAAQSIVSYGMVGMGHDTSDARQKDALVKAERAVKLAPALDFARFALALALARNPDSKPEAIRLLRELVGRQPRDKFMLRELGSIIGRIPGSEEEGLTFLVRAAAVPGGDPIAEYISAEILGRYLGRPDDALAAIGRAVALAPNYADAHSERMTILLERRGDPDAARAALAKVPLALVREDRVAAVAVKVLFAINEPEQVLRTLAPTSAYFEASPFKGPAAYLRGLAHRRAGRLPAAETEWRVALQEVQRRLDANPGDPRELLWKARLLALLGSRVEAEAAYKLHLQLASGTTIRPEDVFEVSVLVAAPDVVWRQLGEALADESQSRRVAAAVLFDAAFDHLRTDANYAPLAAQAKAAFVSANNTQSRK